MVAEPFAASWKMDGQLTSSKSKHPMNQITHSTSTMKECWKTNPLSFSRLLTSSHEDSEVMSHSKKTFDKLLSRKIVSKSEIQMNFDLTPSNHSF